MGFAHMPTLATCVAQAMVEHAVAGLSAYGISWIDDITVVATTRRAAEMAQARFIAIARRLNVELRDMTPIGQRLSAVGIEFDLRQHRWRLQPAWCAKSLTHAAHIRPAMSIEAALQHSGRVAWAAYALQIPFAPFIACLRAAGSLAQQLVAYEALGSDMCTLDPDAWCALRKGLTLIRFNPWRKHAARAPERTVVTDASLSGFGVMYERGKTVVVQSIPSGQVTAEAGTRPLDHITIREAVALRMGVTRGSHARRIIRCITDNTALFWILQHQRAPRNRVMATELMRLLRWCYRNRTTIVPLWLQTDNMALFGADAASRSPVASTTIIPPSRLLECIRRAERDTQQLVAGCRLPRRTGTNHLPMRLVRSLF
jgi:hypothetical protein